MIPLWITKHQSRLPSIFISFFTLVSDENASTLSDNKLKSEISNIRSTLSTTNYKTKFVAVFIGDGQIPASRLEERLNNVRRATNIDSKSLYFLPATSSQSEVDIFADNLLSGLYSACLDYYRELSKHARRKRSRNVVPQPTVPPTSGTSRTLPLSGWHLRYEFKLGIFAEFRQEIEAALQNYEAAYESLFGAEVFEAIPSWSSRFNEARMLSDVIAIRIIRCVLWLGQTTNAVRWWSNHQSRIQVMLDKRSTGTDTYEWAAWQSTWSKTMAELIRRAQILVPAGAGASGLQSASLFISTEKTLPAGQKYPPWESVHHDGYWLNLAHEYTQTRRTRALQIPEVDRRPPSQSPSSTTASNAYSRDKYLVLEPYEENPSGGHPGFNYSRDITTTLQEAIDRFAEHGQVRMMDILLLKQAAELIKMHSWDEAVAVLKPIWENQAWRKSGWWHLLGDAGQKLSVCAAHQKDAELMTRLKWELGHPVLSKSVRDVSGVTESLSDPEIQDKPHAALDTEHALSQVTLSFAFAASDGHVGEVMDAQLSIHCNAQSAFMIRLSQVKVVFEGSLKPVYLIDDNGESESESEGSSFDTTAIMDVKLDDIQTRVPKSRRTSFGAVAAVGADVNLVLRPGHTKVFQLQVVPREAGEVSVASGSTTVHDEGCEMTITTSDVHMSGGQWWEMQRGKPVSRPCGRQRDATSANILPKPPKVEISIVGMQKSFYTNEPLILGVESLNLEDEPVSMSLQVRLLSPGKNKALLKWQEAQEPDAEVVSHATTYIQTLSARAIGEVEVKKRSQTSISINDTEDAIDHELEITIDYALVSSLDTRLTKTLTVDIPIVRPFEANFSFHPRLHQDRWPNFFVLTSKASGSADDTGIKHQYLITAMVCSFALEDVRINSARLVTGKIVGGAVCTTSEATVRQTGNTNTTEGFPLLVHSEETQKIGFDMTLQKAVLGDRQPVTVDLSLEIQWSRADSEQTNISVLHAPKFLILSSEPRVLLQVTKDNKIADLYILDYIIENPSLHFLTFNLSMESSDDFAFSGSKSKSLSLVPMSRHTVKYRILSNKAKAWVKVHLEVIDAYFGQTLKVQPASDGVRVDKQGNVLLWVE